MGKRLIETNKRISDQLNFDLLLTESRCCLGLFSASMKLNENEKQKQITSIGGPALHSALQQQFAANCVQNYS